MFSDQIECYQAIAEELMQVIKDKWDSIDIEAKLTGESSINLKVIYHNSQGRHSFFDVVMLPRYFFELSQLVSTEEKGLYKICNFTLSSDGSYDSSFEY